MRKLSILLFVLLATEMVPRGDAFATQPNLKLTPGVLCTEQDPDFAGYRYKAHIAYCHRDLTEAEKKEVADEYGGIPQEEWKNYEFDHLIPLSIGGANALRNIWPQPRAEAWEKDKVERQAYEGLKNGTLTQDEAIQLIWDWIECH